MSADKKWFSTALSAIKVAMRKFSAENGSMTAAALSFYSFLTLLPLLLLAVTVLAYVIGSSEKAFGVVVSFFNSFLPTSSFITDTLHNLINARGALGLVSIIALLWTGSQYFVILQTALNDVWEVERRPGFISARIKAIILVILFGTFLLLSVASSAVINLIKNTSFERNAATAAFFSICAFIVGLIFAVAMFLVVYKLAPNRKINWKPAFWSAAFAGVVWVVAKEIFRLYLTHIADFNKLYGSLGSVVILVMWLYYSSMIAVLGGELGYTINYGSQEEHQ